MKISWIDVGIFATLVTLVLAGGLFSFIFYDQIKELFTPEFSPPILDNCMNLSLMKTSQCLRQYVNSIYKYNVTEDYKVLTIEELIKDGGDCKNWAELYVELIKRTGYYGKTTTIDVSGKYAHRFAVISSTEGYCVLDQTNLVGCFYFDNSVILNTTKSIKLT